MSKDSATLFLGELDKLLDALYIVGLAGLESAHRADLVRLQAEALSLGLDGAARLLRRLEEISAENLKQANLSQAGFLALQSLRAWADRFRRRYSLDSLDLAPPTRSKSKTPVPFEIIPFLEVAVLGTYPLLASRVLLYCFDLRQEQLVIIEDTVEASLGWRNVQTLLFDENQLDYLEVLENRLYLRNLQKGQTRQGDERLLPALGATYQRVETIERLSLWNVAQANSPLRARSPEEAVKVCRFGSEATKILERRSKEGYEARLLLAPNPLARPKRNSEEWQPYVAIAAAFRPTTPDKERLYSLLNFADQE